VGKHKEPDGDLLIRNYILNGCKDATQAAIDAGYSKKTAPQSASRVLSSVKGKKALAEYKEKQDDGFAWTKNVKLKKLEKMMDVALKSDPEKGMINMASFVAALKVHNEMQGDNAPTVTESTVTNQSLAEKLSGGSKR
jgi:hypothetical protein